MIAEIGQRYALADFRDHDGPPDDARHNADERPR
jgi:hypothetical protein